MALYITEEEKLNEELIEQEQLVTQVQQMFDGHTFHRIIRCYSLYEEWKSQGFINKVKILLKIALRPFGINKSIHYGDKHCYYEKIQEKFSALFNSVQAMRTHLNYEYENERRKSCNQIFEIIRYNKGLGKRTVCIMAPIFNEERLKDGYYRRIKAVDDIIGKNFLKIYMSSMDCCPMQGNNPKVVYVDDEHIRIDYHPWIELERDFINQIADMADIVYHHGVGFMDEDIIRKKHLLKIVDLHGALPEEFAMSSNYPMVQIESNHEELAMRYADYIICVTESMRSHMENKYKQYKQNYIIMPILDQETLNSKISCSSKPLSQIPIITYAGGTQKWQMIETMQECMQMRPEYDYRIFVPNPDDFWKTWKRKRGDIYKLCVSSADPVQLRKEYDACQFGFVLREDTIVNNVACPTKLVEYLLKGIIPILNTSQIGDFVNYGMFYISIEDFCKGHLPDNKTCLEMANKNQAVVEHIINNYISGKKKIQELINNYGVEK